MTRRASLLDVPWLLEQLREFDKFYGTSARVLPEDDEKARAALSSLITEHVVFIAADTCGRMGAIGGYFLPHPDNEELWVLAERFWWVAPEFRGTLAGARLMQAFLSFARENRPCWVQMSFQHIGILSLEFHVDKLSRPLL